MESSFFYTLCVLQGINGALALPFALSPQASGLLQGTYSHSIIAPYRRVCLIGLSICLMLCCLFGWLEPALSPVFAWGAAGFGAASSVGAALIQHGARDVLLLQRMAYLSLLARIVVAVALGVLYPSVLAVAS